MIDLFPPERFDAIISNAGGCGSHLRRYGPLLAEDHAYAARARAWDTRIRDIPEWLGEIGVRQPLAAPFDEPVRITYHESCHLVHGQKVTRQPRAVLRLLPGVELVELVESTWCCGSAGIYALTQPEQATLLLDRKIAHVRNTGAEVLATANPGCHLQIVRGLAEQGVPMRVFHPVSLLAAAYGREGTNAAPARVAAPKTA
jgi:glycolate oxidase iron-sulfur subunit